MEIADSITVRYLSLAILFANAAPPLLLFAIFEQFQSICNLQGAWRGDQPYCRSVMYLSQRAVLGAVKSALPPKADIRSARLMVHELLRRRPVFEVRPVSLLPR